MRRFWKKFLIAAAILLLLPVAAALAATAAVYSMGTIRLDVEVEGANFSVPLPAGLIPLAVRLLPGDVCRELDYAEPQWEALRRAADAFSELPDAILVEVRDRTDHVTVAKRDRRLVVDVRSDDEHIAVSVPVEIVSSVTRQLERTCS